MSRYNKLYVFDFDNTLVDTPWPERKTEWEEYYKRPYTHRGWWGYIESLDEDVFDMKPIPEIVKEYRRVSREKDALVYLITGRRPHLKEKIKEILRKYNLYFDGYRFRIDYVYKTDHIEKILDKFPNISYIEIWDDRNMEIDRYETWKESRPDLDIVLHKVEGIIPSLD
jgi:FMN phosphatase YigB (HAD superfamily)